MSSSLSRWPVTTSYTTKYYSCCESEKPVYAMKCAVTLSQLISNVRRFEILKINESLYSLRVEVVVVYYIQLEV